MELISMTVEQLDRIHKALDRERHTFVTSLPEQAADRLLSYQLTSKMRDDYEQREQNRRAQQRRRARLMGRDDSNQS